MATKRTDISSETKASGGIPAAKSIKQKTMDEVLPKTNSDIPLRPMNNNDPNKPVDAKEMNTIAAANSNHGIKNPPASAAPAAAQSPSPYGRGITEPAVPGAVDPNSAAYAAQQRATYAAGMQQAAAGKLSAEDRLMLRGVDQNISRGQMPTISPAMPTQATGSTASKGSTASAPATGPDTSTAGFYAHAEKLLGPDKYKVFMSMPEAQRNAIYSKFVESRTKNAPGAGATAGTTAAPSGNVPAARTTTAPSGSRFPASALPSGNAPVPTSVPTTAGTGTAESMLRTLRDDTASPEARAQAQTYLRVRTMYAQPEKFGKEIKTLEKLERAKIKELSNMFRNRLNIRDPRFARQYAQYQALRKKDPQARLTLYTELMKGPEFTHLDFRK
jgi:hypothetical protein